MSKKRGLQPIAYYARIKPLEGANGKKLDRDGGEVSQKQITGFDTGSVTISGTNFEQTTVLPDATQQEVYEQVLQPLVYKFIDGYDVDVLCYGQTGAGKTYTMFGPPFSMEEAAKSIDKRGGSVAIQPQHGFILRSGLEILQSLQGKANASLFGSMVEMNIAGFQDQTAMDLLNKKKECFVDEAHHLFGARMQQLHDASDVVRMAAAVEKRLVRGTKMNNTSSRSHCIVVYTLINVNNDELRTSRLSFFDLMGSERFKGGNAAHNTKLSSKATDGGWEGIFANLSLSSLAADVKVAAEKRRKGKKGKSFNPMCKMILSDLLSGSLHGSALTAMIVNVSQAKRNGGEGFLTLKYGADMKKLLNAPKLQPTQSLKKAHRKAITNYRKAADIVERGVRGKYQARRMAEKRNWQQQLEILEKFSDGGNGNGKALAEAAK
eukprot:g5505.t1